MVPFTQEYSMIHDISSDKACNPKVHMAAHWSTVVTRWQYSMSLYVAAVHIFVINRWQHSICCLRMHISWFNSVHKATVSISTSMIGINILSGIQCGNQLGPRENVCINPPFSFWGPSQHPHKLMYGYKMLNTTDISPDCEITCYNGLKMSLIIDVLYRYS